MRGEKPSLIMTTATSINLTACDCLRGLRVIGLPTGVHRTVSRMRYHCTRVPIAAPFAKSPIGDEFVIFDRFWLLSKRSRPSIECFRAFVLSCGSVQADRYQSLLNILRSHHLEKPANTPVSIHSQYMPSSHGRLTQKY